MTSLKDIKDINNVKTCSEILPLLIRHVEQQLGTSLPRMCSSQREIAVKMLLDLGAFEFRGSAALLTKMFDLSKPGFYAILNRVL